MSIRICDLFLLDAIINFLGPTHKVRQVEGLANWLNFRIFELNHYENKLLNLIFELFKNLEIARLHIPC